MTAVCPGGAASQQKPGTPLYVGASLALIDAGLVSLFGVPGAVLSGAIDGFVWNAVQNCATDPPGFPTWSDTDWLAAVGGELNPNFPALRTKINNAILTWLWYQYCQCVPPAATPAQPAPNPPPPSIIIPGPTAVCGTFTYHSLFHDNIAPTPTDAIHPIPAGATSYTINTAFSPTTLVCSSGACGHNVNQLKADGVTLNQADGGPSLQVPCCAANRYTNTATIISGSSFLQIQNTNVGIANDCSDESVTSTVTFYCTPTGGATAGQPCVPCTDPYVLTQLGNINLIVRQILNALPGQQTGWVESTFHGSLSGDGAISVNALTRAVRVNITTDNANLRTGHGDPTYLFDRGFIVPIGLEGPIRGLVRLVYNPQVYILPALTTQIGYSTGIGITISITELLPSP